jgi:hypothetical protein
MFASSRVVEVRGEPRRGPHAAQSFKSMGGRINNMTAKHVSFSKLASGALSVAAAAIVTLACSSSPRPTSATAAIQPAAAAPHMDPQLPSGNPSGTSTDAEDLMSISRQKWSWMAERDVRALGNLFHDEAVFVHMGGTMSKRQELDVIEKGTIHYKHAEIHDTSVRFIGTTAILLSKIRLDAIVGGNEVTNPFMVTEVYVRQDASWRLGAMSFTRLLSE